MHPCIHVHVYPMNTYIHMHTITHTNLYIHVYIQAYINIYTHALCRSNIHMNYIHKLKKNVHNVISPHIWLRLSIRAGMSCTCIHSNIHANPYTLTREYLWVCRFTCRYMDTGWQRLIGCLKMQVIFRKGATNHRALLRKMTYEDKATYASTPPCTPVFRAINSSRTNLISQFQLSSAIKRPRTRGMSRLQNTPSTHTRVCIRMSTCLWIVPI